MYNDEERLRQILRTLYYASGGRITGLTKEQVVQILNAIRGSKWKETEAV